MDNYHPKRINPITGQIPDHLPDYSQPVYTPKDPGPDFMNRPVGPTPFQQEMAEASVEYFDEPDYTQEVMQGVQEILNERPQLTRSEAEEQMHLTELRRLAEGYTVNDAIVISEVLSKNYPDVMFQALSNEFSQMQYKLNTITGAVNDEGQPTQ